MVRNNCSNVLQTTAGDVIVRKR